MLCLASALNYHHLKHTSIHTRPRQAIFDHTKMPPWHFFAAAAVAWVSLVFVAICWATWVQKAPHAGGDKKQARGKVKKRADRPSILRPSSDQKLRQRKKKATGTQQKTVAKPSGLKHFPPPPKDGV
jgi:hypothetical protein